MILILIMKNKYKHASTINNIILLIIYNIKNNYAVLLKILVNFNLLHA